MHGTLLLLLAALLPLVSIALLVLRRRIGKTPASERCAYCGHDLTALPADLEVCPECGRARYGHTAEFDASGAPAKFVLALLAVVCLVTSAGIAVNQTNWSGILARMEAARIRGASIAELAQATIEKDAARYQELARRLRASGPDSPEAREVFDFFFARRAALAETPNLFSYEPIKVLLEPIVERGGIDEREVSAWHQAFIYGHWVPSWTIEEAPGDRLRVTDQPNVYVTTLGRMPGGYSYTSVLHRIRVQRNGETIAETARVSDDLDFAYGETGSVSGSFGTRTTYGFLPEPDERLELLIDRPSSPAEYTLLYDWTYYGFDVSGPLTEGQTGTPITRFTITHDLKTQIGPDYGRDD